MSDSRTDDRVDMCPVIPAGKYDEQFIDKSRILSKWAEERGLPYTDISSAEHLMAEELDKLYQRLGYLTTREHDLDRSRQLVTRDKQEVLTEIDQIKQALRK